MPAVGRRLLINLAPFFILAVIIVIYLCPMITNVSTPGGDGIRVFPYIEFVNNSKSFYPLWNPYNLGGVPTLAGPEKFVWLGRLIDVNYKYANLAFNSILIFAAISIAFSIYALARELSISKAGSIIAGFVFSCSQLPKLFLDSGAIYCLEALLLINLAILLYIRYLRSRNVWYVFFTCLATGATFAIMGYYTLVMLLPFMLLLGYYYEKKYRAQSTNFIKPFIHLVIFSLGGFLFFSVVILPIIKYSLLTYIKVKPEFLLGDRLPALGSFLNIFIPIDINRYGEDFFHFTSIVSSVLLTLLIINIKHFKAKPVSIFIFLIGFSFLFLLGSIYPFKLLISLIQKIPLFWQIRHSLIFYYIISLSMSFLLGFGYDAIGVHDPQGKHKKF
ncbi:hypothetical protein ACFL2W_00155, partial [Candidatus Omnitrophota bacterium]